MTTEAKEIKDGIVEVDTEKGKIFGLTGDKFSEGTYLWKMGDDVYVSFIMSLREGKGNVSRLFDRIKELGFNVVVPHPMGKMVLILIKKGFQPKKVWDDTFNDYVDVWREDAKLVAIIKNRKLKD